MQIKAIALDVDGVLVGQRTGFNSPHPHPDVLKMLSAIHERNIPVILVTSKLHFSIHEIVQRAQLSGYHVADGGAILIDVINKKKIVKTISEKIALNIIGKFTQAQIYTCFYTPDTYFAVGGKDKVITQHNSEILQKKPVLVNSLVQAARGKDITKIMPIVRGDIEKRKAETYFLSLKTNMVLHWAKNPMAPEHWFGFITAPKVSKLSGLHAIVKKRNIALEQVLGVGDSESDLVFMEHCGFVAAMGNAPKSMKTLLSKWGDRSFIGPHVDENGIIQILNHFLSV